MTNGDITQRRLLLRAGASQRLLDDHGPEVVRDHPPTAPGPVEHERTNGRESDRHGNEQGRLHGHQYYNLSV